VIYCIAVWVANYTATWFIPFPVFGMVSVGTIFFGVTFTQRDRVHKYGRRVVYAMIGVAALGMVIESAVLGVPVRIVVASLVAILLAETADTEVYERLLDRSWIKRVMASNAVSIPLDSVIFNVIAFLGVFSPLMLAQIIFGEIVIKLISGSVAAWHRS